MTKNHKKYKNSSRKTNQLIPALVAVGSACTLAGGPAAALELGEIQVNSTLGQPLRASIAYALAPNEQLAGYCIYLRPRGIDSVMPVLSQAQISVTDGAIILNSSTPVREPLLTAQVAVDCPYTPHLVREYTLMIDPARPAAQANPLPVESSPAASVSARPAAQTVTAAATSTTVTAPARTPVADTPVDLNSSYRVQPGDTASTIVARIENRKISLWPAVNALFEANQDAFINGDVDRLMAGKLIDIPEILGTAPLATTAPSTTATATASVSQANSAEIVDVEVVDVEVVDLEVAPIPASNTAATITAEPEASETAVIAEPDTDFVAAQNVTEAAETVIEVADGNIDVSFPAEEQFNDLQPGDVILPPVQTNDAVTVTTIVTDTLVTDETATPAGNDPADASGSWKGLVWVGGAGLALLLGLLLFGRTVRERFGGGNESTTEIAGRRADDDPTQKTRVIEDVDIEFEDTINSRAISLDADLTEGTGFHEVAQMQIAEDYGFSESGTAQSVVDIEIHEDPAAEDDKCPTDVIPPNHREDVSTILEQEIPPEADAGDYDLSMIVDATKESIGDYDATAKDLQAVQISSEDSVAEDHYTLSRELDYQVLEQDYEDELTATQALNAEVIRAAEDLAERLQQKEGESNDSDEITEEVEALEITNEVEAVEKTREMPARQQKAEAIILPEVIDPNNTAELTINLPASLEAENDAEASERSSATTIEMTAAGSDITIDMQVESGRIDTKKRR